MLDELRRVSIVAKHHQLALWVGAKYLRQIPQKVVPERFILDGKRAAEVYKRKDLWEVPFVGKLLDGELDARALLALANNKDFVSLRQELLQAKRVADTHRQVDIIRKLCYLAGNILGTSQKDGLIQHIETLGKGFFISGLFAVLSPTNPLIFLLGLTSASIIGPFLMLSPTAWRGVRRNLISQHLEKAVIVLR